MIPWRKLVEKEAGLEKKSYRTLQVILGNIKVYSMVFIYLVGVNLMSMTLESADKGDTSSGEPDSVAGNPSSE